MILPATPKAGAAREQGQALPRPDSQAGARVASAAAAVARLDAWLETMRTRAAGAARAHVPRGYGGPVAHWWQQSLLYTGAGLDWRYEGIITGYLELWGRTLPGQHRQDERWLTKARRAGDDLISGQLESGNFAESAFEINPATAGTPHEAACDAGLLRLALELRWTGHSGWESYAACAERNLRSFYIGQLWNPEALMIGDHPWRQSGPVTFVPNKAATACEALFLMAELSGESRWVEEYALPTLRWIQEHQLRGRKPAGGRGRSSSGERLRGAIAQNSIGTRRINKYFPLYNARCISALLQGYRWTGDEGYAESALGAMDFIARFAQGDGSLPTVVYPGARASTTPSWLAPLGDILRAADELAPLGFSADLSATEARLLGGQDESGGFQTARGFADQAGRSRTATRAQALPDVRDVLHVTGWCDKAFRYLASHAGSQIPAGLSAPFETDCILRGRAMHLVETPDRLEIASQGAVCYRWVKGEPWPQIASPEFWLR